MKDLIYLVGSEGYIGSLLQSMINKKNIVLIDINRNKNSIKTVRSSLPKSVAPNSTCILLASVVSAKECDEDKALAFKTNVELVKRICDLNFNKIVFTSTASIYGVSEDFATEDSNIKITSYYTETKYQAEKIILNSNDKNVVARLAIAMGASYNTNWKLLLNYMVKCGVEGKVIELFGASTYRPYYDVWEISRALLSLNYDNYFNNQIVNIGRTEYNFSKLDLVKKIVAKLPQTEYKIISDSDDRNYKISFEKYESKYSHTKNIEETIVDLVKNLRE